MACGICGGAGHTRKTCTSPGGGKSKEAVKHKKAVERTAKAVFKEQYLADRRELVKQRNAAAAARRGGS
jgi:hypothetical protein